MMIQIDVELAKSYVNRSAKAKAKGLEFSISFAEYQALMSEKRCHYTGMEIFPPEGTVQNYNTRTIDRVDQNKGYVSGNCVACSRYFNSLKSVIENGNNDLTFDHLRRGVFVLNRDLNKTE